MMHELTRCHPHIQSAATVSMKIADTALWIARGRRGQYLWIGSGSTDDDAVAFRRSWCVVMRACHALTYGEIAAAGRCSAPTVRNAIMALESGIESNPGYAESCLALAIARDDYKLPRRVEMIDIPDFDRSTIPFRLAEAATAAER